MLRRTFVRVSFCYSPLMGSSSRQQVLVFAYEFRFYFTFGLMQRLRPVYGLFVILIFLNFRCSPVYALRKSRYFFELAGCDL